VVKDDDLGQEGFSFSSRVSLGIRGDVSSFDFFNGDVFNVESDVVSWNGFSELFVVHFNGFNGGSLIRGSEVNIHVGFEDSSFDSSDGDSTNTSNFVDIL